MNEDGTRALLPPGFNDSLPPDAAFAWFMVYTGDQVGEPERRRRAVAVEPMTCPPMS